MKKLLQVIIALASFFGASSQTLPSDFVGRWWLGVIQEASLPINLTFSSDGPVLYSPLQSSEPMPASQWSYESDTLRVSHQATGVRLTLVYNAGDTTFSGSFRQGLLRSRMLFSPADTLFHIVRPQTPQPPFPYTETDVVVKRRKAGVTLAGTLTMPEGNGPFPAVVLVSGSGQQNRDEELLGHKPFAVLADRLARNGIAVLRYDDRGTGESTGEVDNATSLDFADDAEAVFEFLRSHKCVDRKRVGIIGHSEGGLIAPIIASHNRKVGFVVLLAGPGTTGADILLQQTERLLQIDSVPQWLIDIRLDFLRTCFAMMDTLPSERYSDAFAATATDLSRNLTAEQRKLAGLRKGDAIAMANQMLIPWMRTFIRLDNSYYLGKTQCPVLAVNGERDCQVLPVNLDRIAEATNHKASIHLLPGLNHLMQHCATGSPSEYMLIDETFAVEAMRIIVDFVKNL